MGTQYFASANSYGGFYSLFGNVFDSKDFDRIFVLKGGPGTGKSTLIKKVADFAKNNKGSARLYYCSSDINSLDGAVIDIGKNRFAIVDGTAPHERDAVIVGAIDEIINLGEGIDSEWIKTYRDDIISLSNQKTKAYKAAYSYLKVAGECFDTIYKKKCVNLDFGSALKYIHELQINIDHSPIKLQKHFLSSFSKNGYRSFPFPKEKYKKTIKIGGDLTNAKILIKFISDSLSAAKEEFFPSPLRPDLPEAVVLDKCLITAIGDDLSVVCSDEFFADSKTDKEELKTISKIHDELLGEAIRWLTIASDIHFRLEDIYVKCVNFDQNEMIFDKISKKILKVCECNN